MRLRDWRAQRWGQTTALPSLQSVYDAALDAIFVDDPRKGRGDYAKAKRQRARVKRSKGRVVNGARKRANRRPF